MDINGTTLSGVGFGTFLTNLREKFPHSFFRASFDKAVCGLSNNHLTLYSVDKCIEILMSKGISKKKALCCFDYCFVNDYVIELWRKLLFSDENFFIDGEEEGEDSYIMLIKNRYWWQEDSYSNSESDYDAFTGKLKVKDEDTHEEL